MIKLVAFDLDGTIGDTIPMCLKALKKAVTPYVTLQAHNLCLLPFSFFLFLRSLYRAGYAFPSLFRIPVSGEVLSSE